VLSLTPDVVNGVYVGRGVRSPVGWRVFGSVAGLLPAGHRPRDLGRDAPTWRIRRAVGVEMGRPEVVELHDFVRG
jgi:hypothetical protein